VRRGTSSRAFTVRKNIAKKVGASKQKLQPAAMDKEMYRRSPVTRSVSNP
jgi:hypothetical protein